LKTKKIILLILLTFLISLFTGCTTKAWYDGIQYEAKRNCQNQPSSEIDQCLENLNNTTYKKYEKEH